MEGNRTVIIAAVITLIIGILFGYNLKGSPDRKADLKELLSQAHSGIEQLQKENEELKGRLEGFSKKGDNGKLTALEAELNKAEQDNESLKSELAGLRAQLGEMESKLKSEAEYAVGMEKMKQRISDLEQEKGELIQLLDKISSLTKQPVQSAPEQTR